MQDVLSTICTVQARKGMIRSELAETHSFQRLSQPLQWMRTYSPYSLMTCPSTHCPEASLTSTHSPISSLRRSILKGETSCMKLWLRQSMSWSMVCLFCLSTSSDSSFLRRKPFMRSWSCLNRLLLLCSFWQLWALLISVRRREDWLECSEGILLATSWMMLPSSMRQSARVFSRSMTNPRQRRRCDSMGTLVFLHVMGNTCSICSWNRRMGLRGLTMSSQMEWLSVLILMLMKVSSCASSACRIYNNICKAYAQHSIGNNQQPGPKPERIGEKTCQFGGGDDGRVGFKWDLINLCLLFINYDQFAPMLSHSSADPDFTDFINAIKSGSVERVEAILKLVSPDMVNRLDTQLNQPPLHHAVISNQDDISVDIIKLLIRHGANYRFKDSIEQTILFYVCRQGKIKCAEVLLSQGLNLDEVDMYGQTPIFYAASENQLDIIRNYATKDRANHADNLAGQTPLYYAARRGHLEMCRVLVEKGADVCHLDSSGKTSAEYAKKAKHYDIAEYLVSEIKRSKDIKFSLPSQSREESNIEKLKKKNLRQTYKIVFLNDKGLPRDLTEEDVRQMIKNKPEIEGYLANPETLPQDLLETSNGEHWQKVAGKVLNHCCKLKGAYWFLQSVDPVKFNIMDYFDIISQPMDLGTIRKKMGHNCYSNAAQFVSDMSLIWENCYKYNGEGHDISRCAHELENSFREVLASFGLDKYLPTSSE